MSVSYPTSPSQQDSSVQETDWISAPATSHLEAFKYVDRRNSSTGGPSEVWVRFLSKGNQPRTEYHYSWYDHDQAEMAFNSISSAEQPGKVIWTWRREKIPVVGPI